MILIFSGGDKQNVEIGIITDLTGPAAYWGTSSQVGAELAVEELKEEGYDINLVYEDYRLDSSEALSAVQKLVNVDDVDGVYAEFNPAAISAGSFLKGKDVLYIYDAAIISPLENNPYAYKTYLDYKEGCRQISSKFREEGIEKMGVLKVNLEFGEICLEGAEEVYGENVSVEAYNLGDQDFKTQILKLNQEGVGAIINVGF